ncbi:MAG: recombinase family protein [Bacillota bacterium]
MIRMCQKEAQPSFMILVWTNSAKGTISRIPSWQEVALVNGAVYIRWSTEDQGTGTTLEVQRDSCLAYAADRGWRVAPEHIFIDDGISGTRESRPGLGRLNQAIQQGSVSAVIVYKLDRLARSPYLAYKLVEKDWHMKASLVSVSEPHIDTTSTTGQLGFGIAAIFAAHERNTIRDRTMSGKRRRAEEGRNPGIRPPYGYSLRDKRFCIVEREAIVIRQAYAAYLAGRTDGQIARTLNDAGIRTRAGGRWHISAVQRMLTNPAYRGRLVYRDITTEDAFPVVVDAEQWELVQALRRQKSALHPRRASGDSPYILSGRLCCKRCGRSMNGRICRSGTYAYRYYACTGSIQFRDCTCPMIRQDYLEEAVVTQLLPLLDQEELAHRMAGRAEHEVNLLRQEVSALESHLQEIDQELTRVRQDYRKARIDADTFNGLRTEIEAERARLSATFAEKRAELVNVTGTAQPLRREVSLRSAWQALSYAQQKQVIHLLTDRIEWDDHARQAVVQTRV